MVEKTIRKPSENGGEWTPKRWHAWLRDHGCCITGLRGDQVVLHHCTGGSIADRGIHRGRGQKNSDWLVIPLFWELHTGTGRAFHQMGCLSWESRFGSQEDFLNKLGQKAGIDVFAEAQNAAS